jgi:CheY-like chemotaxis protein
MTDRHLSNSSDDMEPLAQWVVLRLSHLVNDDILRFEDDVDVGGKAMRPVPAWTVLVVDDDEEVHRAIDLALGGVVVHGRPLSIEYCPSATTARQRLAGNSLGLDLVLLDVVMETADAGLGLLEDIRAVPATRDLPVLLHTGQPGQAPERAVRSRFDISGYLTKSNVTRPILIAALESALLGRKLS